MIELLAAASLLFAVAAVVAAVFALSCRADRDEMQQSLADAISDIKATEGAKKILENRINTLKGDNASLEREIEARIQHHGALFAECDDLKRQLGRIEAERRAALPKRGSNGKFVAKRPATTKAKPKPVACG